MANVRDLETALINADKAGDVAAARTLANALKAARVSTVGQMPSMDPTEGMSGTQKALAGIGQGMTSAVRGVGQAVGMVPQANVDEAKRLDAPLLNTGAGLGGSIVGNMAAMAPTMLIPGGASLPGALAIGAGQGALAPVASDESRLMNMGLGAAGGAVGNVAARGVARLARPINATPAAQQMAKEGVMPTPGQAAGGLLNKIEQKLESIPVVGWIISGSRNRATKELNEAAIKKALPAGTVEQIRAGRAGIERAGELIDGAYDSAYGTITGKVTADAPFKQTLKSIPMKEGVDLPKDLVGRFNSLLKTRVLDRLEPGASAETVRSAHNSLGSLARKYRSSPDPDKRALGAAFAEAKGELRSLVSRQSSGEFKAALDGLDKKYTALIAVEKASGYAGSQEGVFSAAALRRAAQKSDAGMKAFAETGADVLGSNVPDSGTAGRMLNALMPYALGGGGAAANEQLGGPGWLTAAALAPLAYSRLGSRFMMGGYPGQQALSGLIRSGAPAASLAGRSVLLQD